MRLRWRSDYINRIKARQGSAIRYEGDNMDTIKYESPNGYTGILCTKDGKSSLLVFNQHLKEVLHVASPAGDTLEWLMKTVDGMPELLETLR